MKYVIITNLILNMLTIAILTWLCIQIKKIRAQKQRKATLSELAMGVSGFILYDIFKRSRKPPVTPDTPLEGVRDTEK